MVANKTTKAAGRTMRSKRKPLSLRAELKRRTREHLEASAVRLIRKQGFRATSVDQIAKATGTTRTTFYQYFKSKGDLIHFMQEAFIAPEVIAICGKLDDIRNPTWQQLREWVVDYIHVFVEAYTDAAIVDPEVAATSVPNTYWVTGHMTDALDRYAGKERQRVHDKLVILIPMISKLLALTKAAADDLRNSCAQQLHRPLLGFAVLRVAEGKGSRAARKVSLTNQGEIGDEAPRPENIY
jgi:AcrR family transcriptional regulator